MTVAAGARFRLAGRLSRKSRSGKSCSPRDLGTFPQGPRSIARPPKTVNAEKEIRGEDCPGLSSILLRSDRFKRPSDERRFSGIRGGSRGCFEVRGSAYQGPPAATDNSPSRHSRAHRESDRSRNRSLGRGWRHHRRRRRRAGRPGPRCRTLHRHSRRGHRSSFRPLR